MNESKTEYPKRMLDSIRAVKEKRRQERLEAIKASADHVNAELAKPSRPRPNFRRPVSTTRVATIQTLRDSLPSQYPSFPYTGTKRAKRHLRKHPGFAIPQTGLQQAAEQISKSFRGEA